MEYEEGVEDFFSSVSSICGCPLRRGNLGIVNASALGKSRISVNGSN
jgi:hypothetical protein